MHPMESTRCAVGEMVRSAVCACKPALIVGLVLIGVVSGCGGLTCQSAADIMAGLQWNPSSDHLVVTRASDGFDLLPAETDRRANPWDGVWILSSDGRVVRRISREPGFARWVGSGSLLVGSELSGVPVKDPSWELVDVTGRRMARVISELPEVDAWQVSPDGQYLAYVGSWPEGEALRCSVVLYRFGERRTVARYDTRLTWRIAWSPDSRYLYGADDDRGWRVDVVGERLEYTPTSADAAFLPADADFGVNDAGQIVVVVSEPDERAGLKVIDWATGAEEHIVEGVFSGVAFGRDPNVFVCVKHVVAGEIVRVWVGRLRDGAWRLSEVQGVDAPYAVIGLSPDSKRLAYIGPDGSVKVVSIPR